MPYVVPRQLFPLSSRNAAYYLQTNATFLDATYCPFAHPVACCLELLCPFARSFSTNCAISCETHTHFCEGAAQRIDKQNGVRNQIPPYRRWINSISVIIPSLASQGKALRITSLTIDLNMRTMNVILIMLITVVRVFLTNPNTKRCRRCRAMNILFGRKNKEGREVNHHNK